MLYKWRLRWQKQMMIKKRNGCFCFFSSSIIAFYSVFFFFFLISRLKDYHQRPAKCCQTTRRGHDTYHILHHGVCPLRSTGNLLIRFIFVEITLRWGFVLKLSFISWCLLSGRPKSNVGNLRSCNFRIFFSKTATMATI